MPDSKLRAFMLDALSRDNTLASLKLKLAEYYI